MEYETLVCSRENEGVLRVTLNRPASANAINTLMGRELRDIFTGLAKESAVRSVVLTGQGKTFCAGGDIKERNGMSEQAWSEQHAVFEDMVRAILGCPIPLIAGVNGAAFGGGLEIALACDFIYASTQARFALTEVTLGIIPGCGGTQTLARAAGERRAKELVLTGSPFSAAEAVLWGVVNRVCEPDVLMQDVMKAAEAIGRNAPLAVREAKYAIQQGVDSSLIAGMNIELERYNRLISTRDRREGFAAFNERRTPKYEGR